MTTAPQRETHPGRKRHPARTAHDIREALPERQRLLFDQEMAEAGPDEKADILESWATLGLDGFDEFLLSKPFLGLEFGGRSYDDETAGSSE